MHFHVCVLFWFKGYQMNNKEMSNIVLFLSIIGFFTLGSVNLVMLIYSLFTKSKVKHIIAVRIINIFGTIILLILVYPLFFNGEISCNIVLRIIIARDSVIYDVKPILFQLVAYI